METSTVPKSQSKVAFVRSLPATMPAKDVVAKAKAAGLTLSAAYVYVIRSKSGSKKTGRGGPKGRGRAAGGSSEKKFVTLALELGFARAQNLLDDARARVRAAIG